MKKILIMFVFMVSVNLPFSAEASFCFLSDLGDFFVNDVPEFFENDVPDFFENDVPDFFEDDVPDFFENDVPDFFVNDVSEFAEDQVWKPVTYFAEDQVWKPVTYFVLNDVPNFLEKEIYEPLAREIVGQNDVLIEELIASKPTLEDQCGLGEKFTKLTEALKRGPESIDKEVLTSFGELLLHCNGMSDVIDKARDQNYGSILFIVGGEAGYGLGLSGFGGIALSLSPDSIGRWGSVITGVGADLGTFGVSGGMMIGFNRNAPDGVGGGTFDLGIELDAALGGGVGVSFDPVLRPMPTFQQLTVSLAAGVKVSFSGGGGFTHVIKEFHLPEGLPLLGSEYVFEAADAGRNSFVHVDDWSFVLINTAGDLVHLEPGAGHLSWEEGGQSNLTPVPEPTTSLLVGLGFVSLYAFTRRRRQRKN